MPKELMEHLKKVWVAGQQLKISLVDESGAPISKRKAAKKLEEEEEIVEDVGFGGEFLAQRKKSKAAKNKPVSSAKHKGK